MNFRIYIMAIAAMAVGLVELLVGGILPVIASDLNVSLSAAGQLITFFALTYAISGPVLYVLTSRFERKLLYLISLFVFCLANVLTYFSESFFWVMVCGRKLVFGVWCAAWGVNYRAFWLAHYFLSRRCYGLGGDAVNRLGTHTLARPRSYPS